MHRLVAKRLHWFASILPANSVEMWTTEWGEPWEVGTLKWGERALLQLVEHDMLQAKWHAMTAEEKKQTLEMYKTAAVEKRSVLLLLGGRDPGQ